MFEGNHHRPRHHCRKRDAVRVEAPFEVCRRRQHPLRFGERRDIASKIDGISSVDRTTIVSESPVALRVFPRKNISNDDLSRALSEAAFKEQWPLLELHTEEGRLDEVFRTITLPDTKASNK